MPQPRKQSRWSSAFGRMRDRARGMRRKAATIAVAGLAAFMGYHVMFGHNGVTAFEHKRQDAADLHQQMQDLDRENSRLRERVQHLENDPGAIEHQARESLHYTRPGEVIYTLPPDAPAPAKKK